MSAHLPAGTILAASPEMLDPNFMHSVVQLCEHDEHGAFGLLLNRSSDMTVDQLVPDHPQLGGMGLTVQEGGPVGRDRLQFLHRIPSIVPGGIQVIETLHMGGELDELGAHLRKNGTSPHEVRMFLGYSGWGAGQLESEMEQGAWLAAPPDDHWAFETGSRESLWRAVLREIGPGAEGLGHLPPDVSWN
mgnify:CR=1 FL=1|tara:strand:+ start:12158 stop:12724 length:567 start_codon:yes stop_codon:yes gene_type:complete